MIEIYRGTTERLTLSVYVGADLTDPDGQVVTLNLFDAETEEVVLANQAVTRAGIGQYEYITPLSLSESSRTLKVVWSFDLNASPATKTDYITIINPYVTLSEIRSTYSSLADKSDEDLSTMERRVRMAIDRYCGQNFDYVSSKTVKVVGTGSDSVLLPQRILSLTSVSHDSVVLKDGTVDLVQINPESEWLLSWKFSEGDVKSDVSSWLRSERKFRDGDVFTVVGDWGWRFVPNGVNMAALLLIGTYFCSDFNFRNRNVKSVQSIESGFAFFEHEGTGNLEADLILDDFAAPSWIVL